MATHTRAPWTFVNNGCEQGEDEASFFIYDCTPDDRAFIADCGCHEESAANAAHIVRCVNSHDELVAALEKLLKAAYNSNCDSNAVDYAKSILSKV